MEHSIKFAQGIKWLILQLFSIEKNTHFFSALPFPALTLWPSKNFLCLFHLVEHKIALFSVFTGRRSNFSRSAPPSWSAKSSLDPIQAEEVHCAQLIVTLSTDQDSLAHYYYITTLLLHYYITITLLPQVGYLIKHELSTKLVLLFVVVKKIND